MKPHHPFQLPILIYTAIYLLQTKRNLPVIVMAQQAHAIPPEVHATPATPAAPNDVQTTATNIEGHLGVLATTMRINNDHMIDSYHDQSVRMVHGLINQFEYEKTGLAAAVKAKIAQLEVEKDALRKFNEALEKEKKTLKAVNEKLEQEKQALVLDCNALQQQKALLERNVAELEIKLTQSQAEANDIRLGEHYLDAMETALQDSIHTDQPGDTATATTELSHPNKKRKITPVAEDAHPSYPIHEENSIPSGVLEHNPNPPIAPNSTPNITLMTKTAPTKSPYFPAPKHTQGSFLLQAYRLKVSKTGYTKLGEKNLHTNNITGMATLIERVQAMMQGKKLKNSSENVVYSYIVEALEVLGEVEVLPALSSDEVIESWLRRVAEGVRERKPLVKMFVYGKEDEVEAEELMKVHV